MANARSNTVPAPIPAGAVIGGKYRIDGPLAEGGMGVVYRGTHLVLDQPVAIKVVRPELTRCPEAVARFLREARTIASLRGEHITRVLDSGCIKDGPPYMVLEFLEGADLRTLLQRRGPFPMQRAVDLVLQVCEAIAEAHAQGLVHRDIKPENLFLTRRPDGTDCIKVLDFGISKRMNMGDRSYTSQGQSLGSPHYMAPEQMSSPGDVDARADIWSIGVVAFELISGTVPFDGDSLATVCARVLCRPPASLRSVAPAAPVGLEGVILRCLRKPPADRYPTIRALAEALAPYGSEDPTSLLRIRRLAGPQKPILELVPLLPEDEAEPALSESESSDSQRTTRAGFRSKGRPLRAVGIALAAAAAVVAVPYWTAVQKLASDISTDVAAAAASLSATGLVEPKAPRASRYDAPPVPPLSAAVAAYPGHTTPAGGGLLAAPDAPDVAPGPREEASEPAVVRAAAGAESSRGGVQHAASERRKRAGIPAGYRSAPQPERVPEPEPLPSLTLEPEPEPEPKNGDAGSEAARAPQAEPAEPEPVQRLAGQASSAEPEAAETPPRPRQDLRGALRSADAHTGPRYARPGP